MKRSPPTQIPLNPVEQSSRNFICRSLSGLRRLHLLGTPEGSQHGFANQRMLLKHIESAGCPFDCDSLKA